MRLVERHIIKINHQFYKEIDDLAWRSKNLYNYANYLVRQSFIFEGKYLNNAAIFHLVKHHESYTALPRKVSNQVLMVLHLNRAWYKCAHGKLIHADINASLNIIRKVVPAAFSLGITGIAVCPNRITPGKVA